jgi:DNA (cytosine-5)-methyltransferase 1
MLLRDSKKVELVQPSIDDIRLICDFLEKHFTLKYKARGASRLPVLAIYALYQVVIPELKRFSGFDLKNLELHSAADSQTGAVGDIELADTHGNVFEALEIKHGLPITAAMIDDVGEKLIKRNISRYYILTTHVNSGGGADVLLRIKEMKERTGCQIIANGVVPTLRYYLRLVERPSEIFERYTDLLRNDGGIAHEHRSAWNGVVLGKV